MKATSLSFLLLLSFAAIAKSNLLYQTIDVALPDNYTGWIIVVPTRDTVAVPMHRIAGRYQANGQGIAYIPDALTRGQFKINLLQRGKNVFNFTKYVGLAEDNIGTDSLRRYIQFYLPSGQEKTIPIASEYWRESTRIIMHERTKQETLTALLKNKKLMFK